MRQAEMSNQAGPFWLSRPEEGLDLGRKSSFSLRLWKIIGGPGFGVAKVETEVVSSERPQTPAFIPCLRARILVGWTSCGEQRLLEAWPGSPDPGTTRRPW